MGRAPDPILDLAAGRIPVVSFATLRPTAQRHGLGSLLAHSCGRNDPEAFAYLRAAALRELRLAQFQERLKQQLKAANIPSWAYKGPDLRRYLRSPVPRESRDLDLLVPETEIDRAYRVLLSGRRPFGPPPDHSATSLRKDVIIEDLAEGTLIELHWALAAPCWRFHPEPELWKEIAERAQPGPAMMYTILAHHAIRHGAMRLSWLADLVQLTRHPKWDLAATIAVAGDCGGQLAVEASLVLLGRLLDIPLSPHGVPMRARLIANVCERAIRTNQRGETGSRARLLAQILLVPDRASFLRGLVQAHRDRALYSPVASPESFGG